MLQVRNVDFDYGSRQILKDVSFDIPDHSVVSVLGPNGTGKTTLLNISGGLDRYSDGELLINGKTTANYTDREWDNYRNHSVGFVFQTYNLIPHQTVLSNVELALTISGISASDLPDINTLYFAIKDCCLKKAENISHNNTKKSLSQQIRITYPLSSP